MYHLSHTLSNIFGLINKSDMCQDYVSDAVETYNIEQISHPKLISQAKIQFYRLTRNIPRIPSIGRRTFQKSKQSTPNHTSHLMEGKFRNL